MAPPDAAAARAERRARLRAHLDAMERDPEYAQRHLEKLRAERTEDRNSVIAGRDLVAEVLAHPDPCEMPQAHYIRSALLGRAAWVRDEMAMTSRMTNKIHSSSSFLLSSAMDPEYGGDPVPAILDVWKWIYCDVHWIKEDESVQDIYEAQLREEELQTPKERAKERIRRKHEKLARRNAKWIIPILERLSAEDISRMEQQEGGAPLAIWKQASPAPPVWVQRIVDKQQPWGFVFYKSSLVEKRWGRKWETVWEKVLLSTAAITPRENERGISQAALNSIHCQGHRPALRKLWTEDWAPILPPNIMDDDNELRRHFDEYRGSLTSPGILRNVFIVIDAKPIPNNLWRDVNTNLDIFWVWAYDADFVPPKSETKLDGDVYQGRVKVPINCLAAWFFTACLEGVRMEDMWLKAQSHPEKLWICYTNPAEPWEHESYI